MLSLLQDPISHLNRFFSGKIPLLANFFKYVEISLNQRSYSYKINKLYPVNPRDVHQSVHGIDSLGFAMGILIPPASRDVPDVIFLILHQFLSTYILHKRPGSLIRHLNGHDCAAIQLLFQAESMDLYSDALGINISCSGIAHAFNLSREFRGQERLDISVTDDSRAWFPWQDQFPENDRPCTD